MLACAEDLTALLSPQNLAIRRGAQKLLNHRQSHRPVTHHICVANQPANVDACESLLDVAGSLRLILPLFANLQQHHQVLVATCAIDSRVQLVHLDDQDSPLHARCHLARHHLRLRPQPPATMLRDVQLNLQVNLRHVQESDLHSDRSNQS